MTWRRSSSIGIGLTFAAVGLGSCVQGPQTGTLTVSYVLGVEGNTCESFDLDGDGVGDVVTVRVQLGHWEDEEHTQFNEEHEEDAACDSTDPSIVMDDIEAGSYDVLVQGLDAAGVPIVDNREEDLTGEEDERVEIIGGSSRDLSARLSAAPAIIQVRWLTYVDGQPAQCPFVVTQFFQVAAYENMSSLLAQHEFECSVPPGYQTVPDPEREIDGATLDTIRVRALDESHQEVDNQIFMLDPPGAGQTVRIDITCDGPMDQPMCTGMIVSGGDPPDGTTTDGGADSGGTDSGGDSTGG